MASLIIDDRYKSWVHPIFGGGIWSNDLTGDEYYQGTGRFAHFASPDRRPWVYFEFNGTSAQVVGASPARIPAAVWDQTYYSASIDGSAPLNMTYNSDPAWFQSSTLSEGLHSINLSNLGLVQVDYFVIAAAQQTPLGGMTLIVDDDDPSIAYEGNWTQGPIPLTDTLAFGNGTHRTSSVGATVKFPFTGTACGVYGFIDYEKIGTLKLAYRLDNWRTVTSDGSYSKLKDNDVHLAQNYEFFWNDTIAPGDHTLVIEVVEASYNMSFMLDYITYAPAFPNLASKPSKFSQPTTPSNSGPIKSSGKSKQLIGTIIGSLVGVMMLLAAILPFLLCRRRRKRRKIANNNETEQIQPFALPSAPSDLTSPTNLPMGPQLDVSPVPETTLPSLENQLTGSPLPSTTVTSQNKIVLLPPRPEESMSESHTSSMPLDPHFRRRMQRLHSLVLELNQEIEEAGENSPRLGELRGRIAELAREDAESGELMGRTLTPNRRSESVIPPSYSSAI